mmetsp:Transcript_9035/g.33230  ORF Transcript_9035/g.33230 Transcript_9035/m.33230 type:complete len:233 (-) Transcript_9035:175-873(-)
MAGCAHHGSAPILICNVEKARTPLHRPQAHSLPSVRRDHGGGPSFIVPHIQVSSRLDQLAQHLHVAVVCSVHCGGPAIRIDHVDCILCDLEGTQDFRIPLAFRDGSRSVAVSILQVDICPSRDKGRYGWCVTRRCREHQGGPALIVLQVEVRSQRQQDANRVCLAVDCSTHGRSATVESLHVHERRSTVHLLERFVLAGAGSKHCSSLALGRSSVEVCASLDKRMKGRHIPT